jgi:hypothetical protein
MLNWHDLPAGVYSLVEQTPAAVLLESAPPRTGSAGDARFSRLFLDPSDILAPRSAAEVHACLRQIEDAVARGQFAAGFITYESGACFEPSAGLRDSCESQPLAWFGIYDRCHTWDHQAGRFVGAEPRGLASIPEEAAAVPLFP